MANFQDYPCYSPKFIAALVYAAEIHNRQIRKQGAIPYISHLMSVAALVMEAGGSEDGAIAGLLHDAVEDLDIESSDIADRFGVDVSRLVETVSADNNDQYVQQIAHTFLPGAILISAADKLHNLRSYTTTGRSLWKPAHAEFYARLMPIYRGCDRVPRYWLEEMERLLASLENELVFITKQQYQGLMDAAAKGYEWEREFPDPNYVAPPVIEMNFD